MVFFLNGGKYGAPKQFTLDVEQHEHIEHFGFNSFGEDMLKHHHY